MMQSQFTIKKPSRATARFRGKLYMALHGPPDAIRGVTVCVDFAMACVALAGAQDGDILLVSRHEGAPLRRFLAGGAAPLRCPMRVESENIFAAVVRATGVSKATALLAVAAVIRDHGGVGATLYDARSLLAWGGEPK